ncbi:MAG TPA: type IV toxin-antitoxin system AbiEi family antitoxin domain-containing protein [Acidimicrobiales bacterium]|nr:type IV toxin-antitoxin system AbiEi family antitoxin domain-containing protein [Acidimicrobiales bacterium]
MRRSTVTGRVLERARHQGGVLVWLDAQEEGATPRLVGELVREGVLRRPWRGVYVLAGVPEDHLLRVRCALALAGPGSVTSHRSAAWLHGLVDRPPAVAEVTAARGKAATSRKGIVIHSSREAVPVQRCRGVPCTTPLRTLVDLAAELPRRDLDAAVDRALAGGLVRLDDLRLLGKRRSRRGQGRLRLSSRQRGLVGGPRPSVLESRMSRLLQRSGLACLHAEVVAAADGRYRVDYACAEVRLAVEAYGYSWHHTPEQLAHDLERQTSLTSAGWTVLAYTWRQVERDPERVLSEVVAMHARLSGARRSALAGRTGSPVPAEAR